MVGGPRWVSQWATLAASHIRTDPEGSGGESQIMVTEDRGANDRAKLLNQSISLNSRPSILTTSNRSLFGLILTIYGQEEDFLAGWVSFVLRDDIRLA